MNKGTLMDFFILFPVTLNKIYLIH